MAKHTRFLVFLVAIGGTMLGWGPGCPMSACAAQQQRTIYTIQLNDATVNPVTAEYIVKAIDKASQDNAECLILQLDTPGGLLNSTRLIVKKMLTSPVPIIVYIAPSGSRAGSAGVFIAYASHVTAMAPSTNIGAAHPVQMGRPPSKESRDWEDLRELIEELKEKKAEQVQRSKKKTEPSKNQPSLEESKENESNDDPMESKILNDTTAFIRAIAVERNRNVEWAIESVTQSASITAQEALEKKVVEIIATDERDLLKQLEGRTINIDDRLVILHTAGATIQHIPMDMRQRFFNVLADPNIAYMLLILGFYGLLFEVTHPGSGVPGVLGAIFLIIAFYSMQTLPTNYAGLALLILGLVLLIAEAYTPAFGMLTVGGLICMALGSMLLFESVDPIMRVSKSLIIAFSLTTVGITLFLLRSILRVHKTKVMGGKEGLIDMIGVAQTNFSIKNPGKVLLHGEIWNAVSDQEIKKNEEVVILEVTGLTVKVKRKQ